MTDTQAKRLVELAERCEAATADEQRGLLREAFEAVHGSKPGRVLGGSEALTNWLNRLSPFFAMLQANAFESAAMTLVPEGWWLSLNLMDGSHASLCLPRTDVECVDTSAATPALALCAAALRARAQSRGESRD